MEQNNINPSIKDKKVTLNTFSICYTNNTPILLNMKREASQQEAFHIIKKYMGLDVDLILEGLKCTNDEDISLKEKATNVINAFLNGESTDYVKWYFDIDELNLSIVQIIDLLIYCQKKGIL